MLHVLQNTFIDGNLVIHELQGCNTRERKRLYYGRVTCVIQTMCCITCITTNHHLTICLRF